METKSETVYGKAKSGLDAMVETGTVIHQGREFTNGGALYDGEHAIGYLKKHGNCYIISSWSGDRLGDARIVSSWDNPFTRRVVSTKTYQIEACINGVFYTGRGAGTGMIWKGKRKSKQAFNRARCSYVL